MKSVQEWHRHEGTPSPLGVSFIEADQQYNFALYSKHAARVTLLLYAEGKNLAKPSFRLEFDYLKNKSGRTWHTRLPAEIVERTQYYAYRVDGPAPSDQATYEWHAFDEEKILFDPYARALFFPEAFDRIAAVQSGDNEGKAPLGLIHDCAPAVERRAAKRPRHASDLVIYELHVRGFTRNPNSGVAEGKRGTYAGLVEKIPYLKELGVTAVELMPVFQYDPQSEEYWGYMPLSFFAPHQEYSSNRRYTGTIDEFKAMVDALHDADIEVILDVVYNHTAEGNEEGPTYSYKGIDNSTYYFIDDPPERPYADFAGTGNTLNCANRCMRRLIVESLRYWVNEMGVDGFRFDLASIFSRTHDGSFDFDNVPIFGEIAADPSLQSIRLIAEPWDIQGFYQLGRGFPGVSWLQWNEKYRNDVRRFLRGDKGFVDDLMTRLYGSDDLFPDDRLHAYHPYQSVNYFGAHDGFTLYDLFSYSEEKSEGKMIGRNHSWNCGWEGDENVPEEVMALRRKMAKNHCALLMLANGTPMLRAGDEFLQTQLGDKNPYNVDSEKTWLNWDRIDAFGEVHRFFKEMIAFRKRHRAFGTSRFWRETVRWHGAHNEVDLSDESKQLAFFLDGRAHDDERIYTMVNAGEETVRFRIHEPGGWRRAIDTNQESPEDICEPRKEPLIEGNHYELGGRTVVVLIEANEVKHEE